MVDSGSKLNDSLDNCLQEANRGRMLWLQLKDNMGLRSTDALFFFPKGNALFSVKGIRLLQDYMNAKRYTGAIIISDDDEVTDYANKVLMSEKCRVYKISSNEICELLSYYRLVQFFPNIVVVSCDKPYGSDGLIRSGRISEEEYIEKALYV